MPSPLDLALAVRKGQVKLADVPEKIRPEVQKALRDGRRLMEHARKTAVVRPREGRFVREPPWL